MKKTLVKDNRYHTCFAPMTSFRFFLETLLLKNPLMYVFIKKEPHLGTNVQYEEYKKNIELLLTFTFKTLCNSWF